MKKFLYIFIYTIILALLLLNCKTQAQTTYIRGTIKDQLTSQLIEEVVVSIEKLNNHTHTDTEGNFYFSNIPPGNYEIEFEKLGYERQVIKIELADSDTINLNILLFSLSQTLNEIAITADKPVSAASSSYLSQVDFINRPKNSAQDMLRLVPGLFIAQHAGGGKSEQIFIRGFDCDHGTDVATFVDGIPVNMPSHGHGQGYADLHFLIPEVVEGMSIFKGTSSPLYGDFATAAAINFKTLDSLPNNLIQIETGATVRNNRPANQRFLTMLKVPINNSKVSSYFAVDAINNVGFFDLNQKFKRTNIFTKTVFTINENSRLDFSVSSFGSSWNASGQIPERAVSAGLISRFGSIDQHEGGTTQRNNYNLTYQSKLGSGEFETQIYQCSYRFKLFSNFTFFASDSINGDMIEQGDNRSLSGLNAKYTVGHHFLNQYNKFTIGTSFRADEIENELWHAPNRERLSVTAHSQIIQRSSAVYFNEVFRFSKHFRMELGARYDYFIFDVDDLIPTDSIHKNYSGYNFQSAFSPKLNLIYSINNSIQLFLNTGRGFHSNDARSSVQNTYQHKLPLAVSAELGTLIHIANKTIVSAALWGMDLSNELVYVGDDGTTENRGASRRYGIDVSARSQLLPWLYVDADFNVSRSRFLDTIFGTQINANYYIPLAPTLTSAGGLTAKFLHGFECNIRYRLMSDRPANEANTVIARGYNIVDFTANYKAKNYKIGLVIENMMNTNWNEAQFNTESKLQNETNAIEELHFTAGTPFYAKLVLGLMF